MTRPVRFVKQPRTPKYDPLSDRLRVIRGRLGETQTQMAFHFKVSPYTYMAWEKYGCPKTAAARIGIQYILRKLQQNRAGARKYNRTKRVKKKGRPQDPGVAPAVDG